MFSDKKSYLLPAFTVAEILVSITIISVIFALTYPVVRNKLPTKEENMHKKISSLVERLANQMFDSEALYPRTSDITKFGFQNTDEVTVDGVQYGGASNSARKEKFCRIFASNFNTITAQSEITCPDKIEDTPPSFRSTDGVDWWIPQTTFKENTNGQKKGFVKIKVDVNGIDKGNNCTEGSANCRKPDIFYYYIKANGSVTLSNPTIVNDRSYEIIPTIVTKDVDGNVIENAGGTLKIAPINSDGTFGTLSCDLNDFDNLNANSSYILVAIPNDGYVSNWVTRNTDVAAEKNYGYKKVRTTKVKTEVSLEFRQIKKYCIKLKVDCPADDISDCIASRQYKYNCNYVNKGAGQGEYSKISEFLDNYDYVGAYKGNYKFECSNTGNLSFGTGAESKYLYVCGLTSGEYQLFVTPANSLKVYPHNSDNQYVQNVRLGTEDLTGFVIEIRNH